MHDFGGAERDAKQIYGISSASFLKSSASGYASDLAAIRVKSSIDFRTLLKPIAPPQAKGLRIEVIGFPGTHSGLMVGASGSVTGAFPNDRALVYPINTSQGQSGAPIVRDGSTEVIGVHAFDPTLVAPLGVSDVNGGILFDNALLKEIEKWQ
jgi:V8-like Glu-specific endopeptidase